MGMATDRILPLVVLAVGLAGCGPGRVTGPVADAAAAAALRQTLLAAGAGEAGEATAEAGPVGTGWATLRGRFLFAGTPGERKVLVVDKDMEVCGKGGMKLYDQSLRIDPSTKGLADVVIFVRKASRVKEASPQAERLVFDQKDCEFLSPVFAARVGEGVDVRNSDPIGHNTNISGTPFNQLIPAGGSTLFTPNAETGMPVSVTCNIHPWMKAYAVFRKDGYVAVSALDGAFELVDLPAGEPLEFQVWHPRAAAGLKLDRPDLKWNPKGRFQITLQPDEVKDLGTLEVPAAVLAGS
jgi:hypothetical protein